MSSRDTISSRSRPHCIGEERSSRSRPHGGSVRPHGGSEAVCIVFAAQIRIITSLDAGETENGRSQDQKSHLKVP
jgi:hypothetical protein